jgi:hypothetical protein
MRKVSSVDFAIQHNGLYVVKLEDVPRHIACIYRPNFEYSVCSALLKYFKDNGVKIHISGGIYGKHSEHIKLPVDATIPSYGKKPYYTAVSKWAIGDGQIKQDFMCYDRKMANMPNTGFYENGIAYGIIEKGNNQYSQIMKK